MRNRRSLLIAVFFVALGFLGLWLAFDVFANSLSLMKVDFIDLEKQTTREEIIKDQNFEFYLRHTWSKEDSGKKNIGGGQVLYKDNVVDKQNKLFRASVQDGKLSINEIKDESKLPTLMELAMNYENKAFGYTWQINSGYYDDNIYERYYKGKSYNDKGDVVEMYSPSNRLHGLKLTYADGKEKLIINPPEPGLQTENIDMPTYIASAAWLNDDLLMLELNGGLYEIKDKYQCQLNVDKYSVAISYMETGILMEPSCMGGQRFDFTYTPEQYAQMALEENTGQLNKFKKDFQPFYGDDSSFKYEDLRIWKSLVVYDVRTDKWAEFLPGMEPLVIKAK